MKKLQDELLLNKVGRGLAGGRGNGGHCWGWDQPGGAVLGTF